MPLTLEPSDRSERGIAKVTVDLEGLSERTRQPLLHIDDGRTGIAAADQSHERTESNDAPATLGWGPLSVVDAR